MTIFCYTRHINNWREDAAELTLEQRGAYSELIDWFYSTDGHLPADIRKIHRLLGVQTLSERRAITYIIEKFFTEKDGFLFQNGCVKQLKAIHERSEKARGSAYAKYNKNNSLDSANAYPNAYPNGVLSNTHKPLTIKESPLPPLPKMEVGRGYKKNQDGMGGGELGPVIPKRLKESLVILAPKHDPQRIWDDYAVYVKKYGMPNSIDKAFPKWVSGWVDRHT